MPRRNARPPFFGSNRRHGAIHRTGLLLAAGCTVALVVVLVMVAKNAKNNTLHSPGATATTPNLSNVPALNTSQGGLTQGEKFFMQFADRADPTRIAGEVTADTSQPLPERRYQLTKPVAWFFTTDGRSVYVEADEGQMRVASEAARTPPTKSTSTPRGGSGGSGGVETGSLVGNVFIRVFATTADGSRPDINTATPFATLKTSRISVDWLLGQMEIPESFDATWQTLDYAGQAAVIQFDPATRIIDSIAIAKTKNITIRPENNTKSDTTTKQIASSTATSNPNPTPNAQAGSPKQATPPRDSKPTTQQNAQPDETALGVENFYSINTPSTLTVTQGEGLKLVAASLQGYARLVDGKIARINREETDTASPPSAPSSGQATPPSNPSTNPTTSTPSQTSQPTKQNTQPEQSTVDQPTHIALTGPIEVRRILKAPQELARDAWWATLQSSSSQRITADDTTRGLSLLADTAEVAGSRQLLTLNASGDTPLTIQSRDAGDLTARTMQLDQRTNIARVVGSGTLVGQAAKPDSQQSTPIDSPTIKWREKAEFTFARDGTNKSTANSATRLTRAHFLGAVDATSSGANVRANELVTQFETLTRRDAANKQTQVTLPTQSQAIGQASVTDAANALFAADVITVKFTPSADASNAIPTSFIGAGMASAKIPHVAKPNPANPNTAQPTEPQFDHLTAREITGSFHSVPREAKQGEQNQSATTIELATLNATGTALEPVNFQSHDNVRATSLSLAADVPGQEVTLEGSAQHPATLLRDESNITGPKIILNGLKRTAQLPTGGRMELREAKDPNNTAPKPTAALIASADGPITYDESAATTTLADNVVATLEDGVQISRLNAANVTVAFVMPAEASKNSNATPSNTITATPFATNAQVSSVIATGSPNQPASATITNKPATENAPSSTYFVEAPRLTALAQERAFEATGPGRLLAHIGAPEKAVESAPATTATKFEATSAGDTLVQWQSTMSYRESESLAKATGRVRLAHREVAGDTPSLLECETLSLTLANTQPNQPAPTPNSQPRDSSAMGSLFSNTAFTSALAEGGVWGNLQGQEFTSVTATYDVPAGLLEARGDAITPVTIAAAPAKNGSPTTSPLTAARVKINTRDGRVEVIDPGTVQTGPR